MSDQLRKNIRLVLRSKLIGKENSENRNKLINILNISDNTIKSWIAPGGSNIPNTLLIPQICNILCLSYNDFFGIDYSNFSLKEKELLNSYDKSSEEAKAIINNILKIK